MTHKIQLTLDVTLESKEGSDRLAFLLMVALENYTERLRGVRSAVASRNTLDLESEPERLEDTEG